MLKLSVVIITLNEEKNIGRCLESVKDIADEIVIVDSFSTDRTEEICKAYNARFIQHEFHGHIEQKNWAIEQTSYQHVLSLDADEELSAQLKRSILEVKGNWTYEGYYFNRLTNYCGKWIRHTSWYPARKLRLWDKSKGKWGGLNPHDKFKLEKGATKKFLKGDLLHYSYYTINEHIAQINSFSTIVANAYFKDNRRASYFNILFHPIWRFFRDYIIKRGFLDGFYGLVVSVNSSYETFLKYVKLKNLQREKKRLGFNTICFFNSALSWGGGEKWHYDVSGHLFGKNYEVLVVSNKNSELQKRISKTNIANCEVNITNLSFLNPLRILSLSRLFRKENIGTIIINLSSDLKAAGLAAKLAGVKNIIYRRGSALPIRNTLLNRFLFKRVITQVIANSEETSRTILQKNSHLIDESRIDVIYNGIDLKNYGDQKFESIYVRESGEVIIGNAGRLSEEKGQIYLLQLASILKNKGYKFKILIAGTGKLKSRLVKTAKQLHVEDVVLFVGFLENIRRFNQSIDIFVLTSLYEGFGYVLVEAMAEKIPVVAFDIRSSAEIVRNNESGFLVESLNVTALAEKVEYLMNNKEKRLEMGERGRQIVEEVFTFNRTLAQVERLIEREIVRSSFSKP
jgi:glycosyltransferase involved in cell wall biosynthesis